MKTKQKRTILSLSLVVVVLVGVLVGVKVHKNKAAQKEAEIAMAAAKTGILTNATTSYKTLSFFNGNATLSFERNEEGEWFWTNDPAFPLEQSYLVSITETLSSLKPQQTITEGDTLEAYGLDDPSQTLTATDKNGTTTTIKMGNTTTDGNSYYMLMNDAQSPVYIISNALAKEITPGIYDMMRLPELPSLTESQLNSVKISGGSEVILTASHQETKEEDASSSDPDSSAEKAATTWHYNDTNVTLDPQVTSIVQQILGLALDACVDYRPSSQAAALCGFDTPSATITVDYTSDTNASGTLTLTVGNRALDGDGRYVRVNDDTTVYRISADKMDALMKASVSGLDLNRQSSPAAK